MTAPILDRFHPQVATWFTEVFAAPTPVQERAWRAIADGENALVVAPTGSGKTLAAFLWSLNSLVELAGQQALPIDGAQRSTHGGVKVLYISPLKALGVDVENNLRAPLNGIARVAQRMGRDMPDISVGVRSGDTPQAERNRQVRKPPDIDVRRLAHLPVALGLRGVAGAHADRDVRHVAAHALRHARDAVQRRAQVVLHVDAEGLERRDVEDLHAAVGGALRAVDGQGLLPGELDEGVERPEERGERLAGAGGRDHERVLPVRDRAPRPLLHGRGRREDLGEPRGHLGVEAVEDRRGHSADSSPWSSARVCRWR